MILIPNFVLFVVPSKSRCWKTLTLPLPQAGEGKTKIAGSKTPSPSLLGEGGGEGNFILHGARKLMSHVVVKRSGNSTDKIRRSRN
jgi:hypothetical protein